MIFLNIAYISGTFCHLILKHKDKYSQYKPGNCLYICEYNDNRITQPRLIS